MKTRIVTTLDGMFDKMTYTRRDGNTTRLVDNAIQIIFNGHICVVQDHYQFGEHELANEHLYRCIMRRIENEHPTLLNEKLLK